MKKGFLILMVLFIACGLIACGKETSDSVDFEHETFTIQQAYAYAEELGFSGTLEDFIALLSGKDGKDGTNGVDGKDGKDGTNGVDGEDGTNGQDGIGITALSISVDGHLLVTLSNDQTIDCGALPTIKGDKGDTGAQGEQGIQGEKGDTGENGLTPYIGNNGNWWIGMTDTGISARGPQGIQGEKGIQGEQGIQGEKGDTGATGRGIKNTYIDDDGYLVVVYTDGLEQKLEKIKEKHPHDIIEEVVIIEEPTCIKTGTNYVICKTCGELLRTIITNKLPHDFEDSITLPGCTEQGFTTHICRDCGYTEVDSFVPATGHSYSDTIIFDDLYHWYPSICGHGEIVVKESHTLVDGVCSVCSYDSSATLALQYSKIDGKEAYAIMGLTDDAITSVVIPESYNDLPVTTISSGAFLNNNNLQTIVLPETITKIEEYSFYGCDNLLNINIPESMTEIARYAFDKCEKLTGVYYSGSVETWCRITFDDYGSNPLSYAHNLYIDETMATEIVIPDTITEIKAYTFDGWYGTKITLPATVTNIGMRAFGSCNNLNGIYYSGDVERWLSISYYDDFTSNPLYYAHNLYIDGTLVTEIEIPTTITEIKVLALAGWHGTTITIPNTVTSVGRHAFRACTAAIVWAEDAAITEIGEDAFIYYEGTSIFIPDSVISIGEFAFCGSENLTEVTLGKGITSIGSSAFFGCESLERVYYNGNITSWCNITFDTTYGKGANPLEYAHNLYIDNELVTEIIIPDTITTLDPYIFSGWSGNKMTIPDSITTIGVFIGNNNLSTFIYQGTKEQWSTIKKYVRYEWDKNLGSYTIRCTDGIIVRER